MFGVPEYSSTNTPSFSSKESASIFSNAEIAGVDGGAGVSLSGEILTTPSGKEFTVRSLM